MRLNKKFIYDRLMNIKLIIKKMIGHEFSIENSRNDDYDVFAFLDNLNEFNFESIDSFIPIKD